MAETAYGYRQAPVAPTPVREYEIIVRQEPKQARMCGIGGKADRRPIDPPPIVQLRVFDTYPPDPSHPTTSSTSNQFHHQPPQQALNFLQNPYYFMFASLARTESDDELHLLNDGKTRYTTGSVVSSLYHLKDTENGGEDAGFFIFPDLSVRTEGSYRLKLALFELVGSHVQFCKSVYSRAFYVYTAKKFPGMEESTRLSMSLSDQGIKIRIRKDVRSRKRTQDDVARGDTEIGGAGGEDDYDDDDGGDYGSGGGGGIPVHPHAAESARLAITDGSANPEASGNGTGVGGTRGGGRNTRRKASTSTGGARFAADIVPSGKGRPSKRQRTQGGTVIDLSQNSVPLPPAVAVAASMSPPKRLIGAEGGHVAGGDGPTHSNEPSGNGAGSATGGPKSWDHLPEPTIKGGVPIDVPIHPATKLDPRLKHTLPSGSTTPPNGSNTAAGNSAGDTGAANGDTENGNGNAPVPPSGRSAAIQRHGRSSSMNQPSSASAPPLQLQVSGPSQPHAIAPHHQRQHSGSHASSTESYSTPSWAAPQFSPIQPQGMQPHAQQLQGGPLGHNGQPSNLSGSQHQAASGYHSSAPRPNPSGMSVGPGGMGMGMALPPLQIPPQQQGPRGVSMNMHGMPPLQQHGYAQGYAGGSADLTTSPEMMHPSMSMGPPPPPSHGHTPTGYGEPSVRQGMMIQPHQQNYMTPDGPSGPVYAAHSHGPMQMQGHMQQYPTHHHTYSHPPSQQPQQQPQPHSMAAQPLRPSPTTYAHHGHHLSDPTHGYDAYGPGTGNGRTGGVETSPRMLPMGTSPRMMALGASPGGLNMGLSPISPTRGTPLSAHPPPQQQQDMYASGSGVGRDPYAQPGYPTRHAPQQQQHPGYGERHVQGGHSQQGPYQDVGPSVYGHGHHVSAHPQSNAGYPHPHGERGWGQEEE